MLVPIRTQLRPRDVERPRSRPPGFAPAIAVVIVVMLAVVGSVVPSGAALAACWRPPVVAPVVDPYREPTCRWCPGNRGIEYATRPGQPVTAVETGWVRFAGDVAGTTYVVVEHRDRRRVTYGSLAERRVDVGDLVLGGRTVGTTSESFHFGVRVGDRYVDPTESLGRIVGRPRLVPADGSAPAPAPPPIVRCGPVDRGAIGRSPR